MAYDPIYTHEDYLFEEVTINGKKLQMIADDNKVSRSCIYSYVKKFNILSDEYAEDITTYQRIRKLRREWDEKHYGKNAVIEREAINGFKPRLIERNITREGVKGEIHQVIETDYDWTEEDYKSIEEKHVPLTYLQPNEGIEIV